MTEADGVNGPGADVTPPAGGEAPSTDNRTVLDNGAGAGSLPAFKDMVAGLTPENRTLAEAKNWDGLDNAFKAYRELETHVGKALVPPGKDATAEDWDKFYGKLGRPEKPEGYELKVSRETLPADFPYDETLSVEFRNWAHEAGLSPKQAQSLHDKFVGKQAGTFTGMRESVTQKEQAAHAALVQEFGQPDTDGYKRNVEMMSRAARQLDITDALKETGLLTPDGAILNAKIAKALAKVGKDLFSEDSYASGDGGVINNPWSKESPNLTQQGQLVRSDPPKARALMRAAGLDPNTIPSLRQ